MTRKTSFYYSFLVLPADQRRAITAVFDVCRAIDDCVDLEPDPDRATRALALWRQGIARVFEGGRPRPPRALPSSRSSGRFTCRGSSSRR